MSLEDQFWQALEEIARVRELSVPKLVVALDTDREHLNLCSVIRVFVLDHYRRQAEQRAGRTSNEE